MSVLVWLIAVSVLVAAGFLGAFAWAVRTGQFDDTSAPPLRVLFDDSDSATSIQSTHAEGAPHVHSRS